MHSESLGDLGLGLDELKADSVSFKGIKSEMQMEIHLQNRWQRFNCPSIGKS